MKTINEIHRQKRDVEAALNRAVEKVDHFNDLVDTPLYMQQYEEVQWEVVSELNLLFQEVGLLIDWAEELVGVERDEAPDLVISTECELPKEVFIPTFQAVEGSDDGSK